MNPQLKENLSLLLAQLAPTGCRLVAVSKTKPVNTLMEAYGLGIRVFGENKVQEMTEKHEALPKDIEWHMIGHLQTNKVKYIAPFVSLIHSVDSFKLLKEIDKRAAQNNRKLDCLLQIHIAREETKFGLDRQELFALLESPEFKALEHVCVKGLMGMATNTDNSAAVREEFKGLRLLFEEAREKHSSANFQPVELSMGMSGDYLLALEEGSTLVRVGSLLFGERQA